LNLELSTLNRFNRCSEAAVIPGEILYHDEAIVANAGRAGVTLSITNRGDRPIQVGSHFHFFEVNPALDFDRAQAYGMRLNIPAGTAVRFEPGMSKTVELVALAGRRRVFGLNQVVEGNLDDPTVRAAALARLPQFLGREPV
jgi:urease beta subunit